MTQTATVTIRGVILEVDFSYTPAEHQTLEHPGIPEEIDIEEIRHEGIEIMCFFADDQITAVRDAVLEQKGEYHAFKRIDRRLHRLHGCRD